MKLFGQTRTSIQARHALITPDGFVPSVLPGWESALVHMVISPALGARLNQWVATLPVDSSVRGGTGECSLFVYVLEGSLRLNTVDLVAGGYAYLPPGTVYSAGTGTTGARVLVFEKRYEVLGGCAPPKALFGAERAVEAFPFLGQQGAMLKVLLPDSQEFDMAVNIFTYRPGATLPFVETHIMEHGMMMIRGQGLYRMEERYYPVAAGDMIWMAPYCPQWYVSIGDEPSSYIYYKDVNRHPVV